MGTGFGLNNAWFDTDATFNELLAAWIGLMSVRAACIAYYANLDLDQLVIGRTVAETNRIVDDLLSVA